MKDWPHAPVHRFHEGNSVYFVTGAAYQKQHIFRAASRLDALRSRLFSLAAALDCILQAWAIFSNHYHLVVSADGLQLRRMLTKLHTQSAIEANEIDRMPGRQVWFQFRETELTFEKSWLARLRYTHENAVHHRLVTVAAHYPWCSAAWFETYGRPAFVKTVRSFKIDRVNVHDAFDVPPIESGV